MSTETLAFHDKTSVVNIINIELLRMCKYIDVHVCAIVKQYKIHVALQEICNMFPLLHEETNLYFYLVWHCHLIIMV